MTVVSSLVVLTAIESAGSLEKGFGLIITIFFVAGALLVVFGLCKLETYIKYIPYPVVSGFMTGIGMIIIIFQIFPIGV
jgi:sulfate permease, SulP family